MSIDEWLYLAFDRETTNSGLAVEKFWYNIGAIHSKTEIKTNLDLWVSDLLKFILWVADGNKTKVVEFIRLLGEKNETEI